MATQTVLHTYQLKRAYQNDAERINPILLSGEPIVVYCNDGKTRMKIGDGVKEYNDLNFIGDGEGITGELEIINRDYHLDFPNAGDVNKIYKAEKEQKLYQWNPNINKYEPLDNVEIDIGDIKILSGGDASDLLRV